MDKSNRASRDKKKRKSGQQHQHHPWDEEVSLPGAATNEVENPTILKVLNTSNTVTDNETKHLNKIVGENSDKSIDTTIKPEDVDPPSSISSPSPSALASPSASTDIKSQKATLASSADENALESESVVDSGFSGIDRIDSIDSANVLDIDPQLIETYDEYIDKEDSIGIKELQPIQDELIDGPSEIESNAVVRTVIEVEPVGVQTKKAIETVIQHDELTAKLDDTTEDKNETKRNLDAGIPTEAVSGETKDSLKESTLTEVRESPPPPLTITAERSEINEDIKRAAEILVSKIESDALEATSRQIPPEKPTNANENHSEEAIPASEQEKFKDRLVVANEESSTLSQRVDEQLSEVTSILKKSSCTKPSGSSNAGEITLNGTPTCDQIKLVDVPSPKTALEAEERKLFIDSLPQISSQDGSKTDAQTLATDCKREFYQSLKKYLIQSTADKPPVPLQTYRWEDLKRARERGGYPWTHLYKRPLGPDEEPEIVLLLRKSQELRFASESPKSLKKVRIDDQVLIKETERYIQELSEDEDADADEVENEDDDDIEERNDKTDDEDSNEKELKAKERGHSRNLSDSTEDVESQSVHSECVSCVSDSVLATGKPRKPYLRLANIRAIIKRRRSGRTNEDAQSLPGTLERKDKNRAKVPKIQSESVDSAQEKVEEHLKIHTSPQHKSPRCFPIMKKLKSIADRQKKRMHIKRVPLKKDERIVLNDETKILKLKKSPKSERSEIPHFIEKQDSDDVLEIVELDESPSRKRREDSCPPEGATCTDYNTELAQNSANAGTDASAGTSSIVQPDEVIDIADIPTIYQPEQEINEIEPMNATPPKKAPRLRREHVYEEISQVEQLADMPLTTDVPVIEASVSALKESLQKQDTNAFNELENSTKPIPLDRMGSSEEEATNEKGVLQQNASSLAPISSIDSASSDEERGRTLLSPVSEESDAASNSDYHVTENEIPRVISESEQHELKSSIKKEASPAPSDKKVVTFSHVEDEAEPHREDIELPEHILEASAAQKKSKTFRKSPILHCFLQLLLTLRIKNKHDQSKYTSSKTLSKIAT